MRLTYISKDVLALIHIHFQRTGLKSGIRSFVSVKTRDEKAPLSNSRYTPQTAVRTSTETGPVRAIKDKVGVNSRQAFW